MKRSIRQISVLLAVLLLTSIFISGSAANAAPQVSILFTHDMHAHFQPVEVALDSGKVELGGYARLMAAINEQKKIKPDALLVDAGDFSMGTLYQTIFMSDAPDLRILGKLGYDAVTLGNHEFDFRGSGLAESLNAAINSGDKLSPIVLSNYAFPANKDGVLSETLTEMKTAMEKYGVKDYMVINKNGVKIGLFGLMGIEAAADSPKSDLAFTDQVENAKRVTAILKDTEKVDIVICLSHSGTWTDKSDSEDEILAAKVPGIDVIVSGHTHTKLDQPIITGKTTIVSCGENAEYLGSLDVSQNADLSWKVDAYKLIRIDNTFSADSAIAASVDSYRSAVQSKYLDKFGYTFDQVLAYTPFDFTASSKIGVAHSEDTLGNLITDAYVYAVKQAEGADYEPVDVAIVPKGIIRGSFVTGGITVSDVFNVSSLGIGADGVSGYPLISVYLTGKEIKTACEVDASISPIMSDAQLYMAGVSFTFNPNRLIFNKVTDVMLQDHDGTLKPIDDSKLYRVVAGLYSAQMLSIVGEKSYGLLSIVPKLKDGTPITDFEAQIIYNRTVNGTKTEVKEWISLALYLQSFPKIDGLSQVTSYYQQTHSRKIVSTDKNIFALISKPNTIAFVVYMVILLILLLIIYVVYRIITHKKRKARKLAARAAKKAIQ